MVHMNFAFSRGANLQFAHIDGTVSIYPSQRILSHEDGMNHMLKVHGGDGARVDRILAAWDWLKDHNRLYQEDQQGPPVPFEDLDIIEENPFEPNLLFPEAVFAAAEAGPRAGDTDVAGLQVGTDLGSKPQYFRNPTCSTRHSRTCFLLHEEGFHCGIKKQTNAPKSSETCQFSH